MFIDCIAMVAVFTLHAQGITISSGTTVSLGSATLSLPGNWSNSGTFNAGSGTVVFTGASGTQTITNASGETFYNLTVNKASGDVQLVNDITVNGTLTTTNGDLDLNSHTTTLGSSATLSETDGNTVKGTSGTIGTTRTLGTNPGNVGGLGLDISASPSLGVTTIARGHAVYTSGGHTSILRNFTVTPTTNSSLNATAVFHYDASELNSLTSTELLLFASTNSGTDWSQIGGTVDTTSKTLTVSSINSFSLWTLAASSAPLPVELTSFSATSLRLNAELQWKTATEADNYGFEVERRRIEATSSGSQKERAGWTQSGFVEGAGTSVAPREYTFTDKNLAAAKYEYRLKQIDRNGNFKYLQSVQVDVGAAPRVLELSQNYPNPFNPATNIEFTLPKDGRATLKIFNNLGQEVATLFDGEAEAGKYNQVQFDASNFASGLYFSRLQFDRSVQSKKMLFIK